MNRLSIIIPCYNESLTIVSIIEKILNNKQFDYEIIVIDDFSTDGSREILKTFVNKKIQHLILNDKNYGKGYSVRQGINKATNDILLIRDADLEYDPLDYGKLVKPILDGYAEVVFGSRFVGSQEKRVLYFWHRLGNGFLTLLSNVFTNLNMTDMECCYKVFKSDLIKNINLKENRFGFEPEIVAKVSKKNLIVYEVGVKYYGRKYSEGKKITWKDGFSAIKSIIKYNIK